MAIPEVKFCRDCTYYMDVDGTCYQAKRVDLVTGDTTYGFANSQRYAVNNQSCGPEAKYWTPLTVHPYTETTNGNEG